MAATAAPICRARATSSARSTSRSQALKPEKFDNYEVGAKWEPLPGLLATVALYQLDRTNTRATDPVTEPYGADRRATQPRPRSRGRAQHHRSLAGLGGLRAAEGRDHAHHRRRSGGPRSPARPAPSGFSLWSRYDFTPRLGLGFGVVARTKSFTSISNAVELPGYARLDAAAFFGLAKGIEAQLNVENLFGARLFLQRAQRQ